MNSTITEFGIKLNLEGTGFNEISAQFKRAIQEGKACGKSFGEINEACNRLGESLKSFNTERIDYLKNQLSSMKHTNAVYSAMGLKGPFGRDDFNVVESRIAKFTELINQIPNAQKKAFQSFGGKSGVELLEDNIKKVFNSFTQLKEAFYPVEKLYRWVDGIAKLNHQLRMLHYSSGMAIDALKTYGNTAALYGGSANTVASYERRHEVQIARAQRGMGLGHFQDAYWQFGFGFDINESAQDRFRRAIAAASKMNQADRLAFAQLEAPGREKELLAWAQRGVGAYDELIKYQRKIAQMTTIGGKNLNEVVSKESEALAESQNKLSAQFDALKNEIAATLMPILRVLTDALTTVLEGINSLPSWLKRTVIAIGAFVGAIYATIKVLAAIRRVQEIFGALSSDGSAAGTAGNVAGSVGSSGGNVAGKASKLFGWASIIGDIANVATTAVVGVGLGAELSEIHKVICQFYGSWMSYNEIAGANKSRLSDKDFIKAEIDFLKEIGVGSGTAEYLTQAGMEQAKSRLAEINNQHAIYTKIDELISVMSQNSESSMARHSGSPYIAGNVSTNNDNRTMTINQNFVASGDMQKDAQTAADAASTIGFGNSVNSTSERG